MKNEHLISIYLFFTRIIFGILRFYKIERKTVFLSTFGDNAYFIAKKLAQSSNHKMIFINKSRCKIDFHALPAGDIKIYTFETLNVWDHLYSLYHLATAKYVFIDNYVGILAAIRFKEQVKCIQLWHAAGAIKRFGWSEPATKERSKNAQLRFQRVYDQFQYMPVGCFQMAHIFSEAFHLEPKRFLYTGVPQTDFYFDKKEMELSLQRVRRAFPEITGKKIVLYAPTFRKSTGNPPDINGLADKLDGRFLLMVRMHPSVPASAAQWEHPCILNASLYPHVNELLAAADILITDYSSLAVEFSLLRKKMIFFTYDLESYIKEQGLWAESDLYFPGPIVKTTSDLFQHIIDPHIDFEKIEQFNDRWNTFSKGRSSHNLILKIYHHDDLY